MLHIGQNVYFWYTHAMDVYDFTDYREAIRALAKDAKLSFRKLSEEGRINPSYFSRVLAGRAGLSSDQLFNVTHALRLGEDATAYLLLLRELDDATVEGLRRTLQNRLDRLRKHRKSLSRRLRGNMGPELSSDERMRTYFEDALTARVMMHLSLAGSIGDLGSLANSLLIPKSSLARELKRLENLGLVTHRRDRWHAEKDVFIHLDESHPIAWRHHVNWRLEAIERLRRRKCAGDDFSVSVCFSATPKARAAIRERFKQFVVDTQRLVAKETAPEEVYIMNFDLLSDVG